MSRETSKSKVNRSKIMEALNIPVVMRSAFIRFCRHGDNPYKRERTCEQTHLLELGSQQA